MRLTATTRRGVPLREVCARRLHGERTVVSSRTLLDRLVLPVVDQDASPLGLPARVRLAIEKLKRPRLEDEYVVGKEIGRGRFGVVHQVTHRVTGRTACVKTITKFRPGEVTCRKNASSGAPLEVEAMAKLKPPCLQLVTWFESPMYVHIVMELLHGGNLFDLMKARGWQKPRNAAGELWTATLVASLLQGLVNVHQSGVVHLDVKLDNLCFRRANDDFLSHQPAVLIDFGSARLLRPEPTAVAQTLGSPSFVAPEVRFDHVFFPQSDAFSFGVVVFALLMGFLPFDAAKCTSRADFEALYFCPIEWSRTSADARAFTRALLEPDPVKRMSVLDAAEHKWVKALMEPLVA